MTEDGRGPERHESVSSDPPAGSLGPSSLDEASSGTADSLLRAVAGISEPPLSELKEYIAGAPSVILDKGTLVAKRYRLERHLGRGGMGVVWEATHLVTQRRVAIKFVKGPTHQRADLRRRLLREARAASAAKHPNIVEVLDLFELDDGTPVMVMELLSGETLRGRMEREGRLPLDVTASLFLPVVAAVGAVHALGIVHRDLKPENVFLVDGRVPAEGVKVLDFGIAKLTAHDVVPSETESLTNTGSTLGTPAYMAPEQTTGDKDVDPRADIWALGVMLYECLTGVRPLEGSTVGQVVMKLMTDGIKPLGQLAPELPAEASALVMRMLSRAREDRPRSLQEVSSALAPLTQARVAPPAEPAVVGIAGEGGEPDRPLAASEVDTQAPQAISNGARRAPRRAAIVVPIAGVLLLALAAWRASAPAATPVAGEQPRSGDPMSSTLAPVPLAAPLPDPSPVSPSPSPPVAASTPLLAIGTPASQAVPVSPGTRSSSRPAAVLQAAPAEAAVRTGSAPAQSGVTVAASSIADPPQSPQPSISSAQPATPGRPECDPPFEFDRKGRKMWKRQCL